MKKFYVLFTLLAATILIAGCSKTTTTTTAGTTGQVSTTASTTKYLVYDDNVNTATWDPSMNTTNDGANIINNMFEGLFRATPTGVTPADAKSVNISSDGKIWTFQLDPNAKWSNGQPVTAYDYQFAWLRVLNPADPSEYAYIMQPYIVGADAYVNADTTNPDAVAAAKAAVGIKVLGDFTLEVDLTMPVPYFTQLLSFMTYMPEYSDRGTITSLSDGWEKDPKTAISDGPFELASYTPEKDILLVKNPYYVNAGNVKIAGVDFQIITDATTGLNAYNANQIQVMDQVPSSQISNLLATNPDFSITAQVGTFYYAFNMDNQYIGDPAGQAGLDIRQALSMAIDRNEIINDVVKGGELPATTFLPPTLTWSDGTPADSGNYGLADTAKVSAAKTLFDQGLALEGITAAQLADSIQIAYNNDSAGGNEAVTEAIQEQWKQNLGLEDANGNGVQLVGEDWDVYVTDRTDGKFAIARDGWLGDYPDPNTMLDLFTSDSGNNDEQWRYQNPNSVTWDNYLNTTPDPTDNNIPYSEEFDQLIQKAFTDTGTARDNDFKAAEKIIMQDETIVMPVYYYTNFNLVNSSQVTGVTRTQMGMWYFGGASWVD